jgi:hypothetical protein
MKYFYLCLTNFNVGLVSEEFSSMMITLKKRTEQEIHEEQDASLRSEYFDPIEHFPDKVDQLLDALNRVCLILIILYMCMVCGFFSFI